MRRNYAISAYADDGRNLRCVCDGSNIHHLTDYYPGPGDDWSKQQGETDEAWSETRHDSTVEYGRRILEMQIDAAVKQIRASRESSRK